MKATLGFTILLGAAVAFAPMYAVAQTSLGEVNTTIRMQDELNNIGGGPTMGGGRPSAPPGYTAPAPPSIARPAPGGPAAAPAPNLAPSTGANPAAPAPVIGSTRRVVKGPENGFVPTYAAQVANLGFEHLHNMRFEEAVEAYRRAKDADSRYEPAYQGVVQAVDQINKFGPDTIGQIVMSEQPVKVTVADYFGWNR